MNEEILKLAKECTNLVDLDLIAFYRAAYNKAIEDAAQEAWNLAANVSNHRDADYVRDGITALMKAKP